MKLIKKTFCAAVAVAVSLAVMLTVSCSTPKIAATVDGHNYTTGEYLAALYNFYSSYMNNAYNQYQQYGYDFSQFDPWSQQMTYGTGDAAKQVSFGDWLTYNTEDSLKTATAVDELLTKNSLSLRAADQTSLTSDLAAVSESDIIKLGFNSDSYKKILTLLRYGTNSLLYGLYDTGGKNAMSDADIQKYFDDNFRSFKIVELPLTDSSSGADLSADDQQKVVDRLQGYLDTYNTDKDFDAIIAQSDADTQAEQDAATATDSSDSTDDTSVASDTGTTVSGQTAASTTANTAASTTATATVTAATTTTAATTAVTTATTDTTDTTTTTEEPTTTTTAAPDTPQEKTDSNRMDIYINTLYTADETDHSFTDAINKIPVGDAQLVKSFNVYGSDGTLSKYAAVILRMDPLADRSIDSASGEKFDYMAAHRDDMIYNCNIQTISDQIKALTDSYKVTFVKAAIDACDPNKLYNANYGVTTAAT